MSDDGTIQGEAPLNRETWRRLARAITNFGSSEVGGKARALFAFLVGLLLAINGLNVVNSYVGRDFMTAIERRDWNAFLWNVALYLGVFAVSTVVAVVYRFTEERLGLLWREWMTRRMVHAYLDRATYYRLNLTGTVPNPDQRMADDVRAFSTMTLSLLLMFLNGVLTILAFGGVLWSISVPLFCVAVGYAVAGSILTIALGRPLIWLNYNQADMEANFRADLTHIRENAESVALLQHEARLETRLLRHVDALAANLKRIIAVNRNLGFFTTGYNYMIQLIPTLIVAPLFLRGEAEFGVITQAAMAFSHLMGAFSLVVTQFPSISTHAALLARLSALVEGVGEVTAAGRGGIELVEDAERLAYEQLTLRAPQSGRVLVESLTVSVPAGTRLLVRTANDAAGVALIRATAGIWDSGTGRILRPAAGAISFVAERPYLPPGTLRELLVPPGAEAEIPDERILGALRAFALEPIVSRAGGLDIARDWDDMLSLDEQQLLCVARLLLAVPRFVVLDRIGTALDPGRAEQVLATLARNGIPYVDVRKVEGGPERYAERYDAILDIAEDGGWTWTPLRPGAAGARIKAG